MHYLQLACRLSTITKENPPLKQLIKHLVCNAFSQRQFVEQLVGNCSFPFYLAADVILWMRTVLFSISAMNRSVLQWSWWLCPPFSAWTM